MTYHSAQVHFAVARLIRGRGVAAAAEWLDCATVDVDGTVGYRVTAHEAAQPVLANVLREALGNGVDTCTGQAILSQADATRLLRQARRDTGPDRAPA